MEKMSGNSRGFKGTDKEYSYRMLMYEMNPSV